MIARDDHVKILDFGLAKPIAPAPSDASRVTALHTNAGTVLGTFAYMAPDHVRGLALGGGHLECGEKTIAIPPPRSLTPRRRW